MTGALWSCRKAKDVVAEAKLVYFAARFLKAIVPAP
jgi:hypothetical protein